MDELRIEYLPVEALTPYENNARAHGEEDVGAIAESIRQFGFRDPIGVWGRDNVIVEGHGRLLAARQLGMAAVPVIRLDDMTDEERRAYALAHNRTAELSRWDETIRELELRRVKSIDMSAFRFDVNDLRTRGAEFFGRDDKDGAARQEDNDEYNAFLEKFEPKKTTDDCYTPDYVYDAVAAWVEQEYGVKREEFVRPFYPGGDYQAYSYPDGCAVVDNPPFSILSKIEEFYLDREIKFFLFAPGTKSISNAQAVRLCAVCAGAEVIYENGANVNTSFVTNMEPGVAMRSAPELRDAIKAAQDRARAEQARSIPKYIYPDHVVTTAMVNYFSCHHVDYKLARQDCLLIDALDAQREVGKTIFGDGYLLSEKAAAEKAAAEKAAATKWGLSKREKDIVRRLSEGNGQEGGGGDEETVEGEDQKGGDGRRDV